MCEHVIKSVSLVSWQSETRTILDANKSLFVSFLQSHSRRPWLIYCNALETKHRSTTHSYNRTLKSLLFSLTLTHTHTQKLRTYCSCTQTHLHTHTHTFTLAQAGTRFNNSVNTRTWCELHELKMWCQLAEDTWVNIYGSYVNMSPSIFYSPDNMWWTSK